MVLGFISVEFLPITYVRRGQSLAHELNCRLKTIAYWLEKAVIPCTLKDLFSRTQLGKNGKTWRRMGTEINTTGVIGKGRFTVCRLGTLIKAL